MRLDEGQIEVMDDSMSAVLAAKSPAERLEIACGLRRSAGRLIAAALRMRRPDWSEQEIDAEVIRRLASGNN